MLRRTKQSYSLIDVREGCLSSGSSFVSRGFNAIRQMSHTEDSEPKLRFIRPQESRHSLNGNRQPLVRAAGRAEDDAIAENFLNAENDQNASSDDSALYMCNVLVVGESGVGKTSIIRRYVYNDLSENNFGLDYHTKVIQLGSQLIRVRFCDIRGEQGAESLTRSSGKDFDGAIVVYDVNSLVSFQSVRCWKNALDTHIAKYCHPEVPCILIANKRDVNYQGYQLEKLTNFCKLKGFCNWFLMSALHDLTLEEPIRYLVSEILERKARRASQPKKFNFRRLLKW